MKFIDRWRNKKIKEKEEKQALTKALNELNQWNEKIELMKNKCEHKELDVAEGTLMGGTEVLMCRQCGEKWNWEITHYIKEK